MPLLWIDDPAQWSTLPAPAPGVPALLAAEAFSTRPARHLALLDPAHGLLARCALWFDSIDCPGSLRPGVIGQFACADPDSGRSLLEAALQGLRDAGCDRAIGPMDGNTWRHYRLATGPGETGDQPGWRDPFFLEPTNPPFYPATFTTARFEPLALYYSARVDDLSAADPRMTGVWERLQRAGVHIRTVSLERFEADARAIYTLSLDAFRQNFLYTPIEEQEFLAAYHKVKPHIRPDLCLLAEDAAGELVGFIFCLPDLLQAQRGEPIDRLIVKTLAVSPGRQRAGLGGLLVERTQHAAHAVGFRRAVHALMHQANKSRNLHGQGPTIREYTLFSKAL